MDLNLPGIDQQLIPYGRQQIDEIDCDAVTQALRSANLTQGKAVDLFESNLASTCSSPHAVAVANGTAALHLAFRALDCAPGAVAITTPVTFAATANAMLYCGLRPVFTDIDERSGLMCMDSLESILRRLDAKGCRTAAVVPVHYSGAICDMDRLWTLKSRYGFKIIEDASHALGGKYASGGSVGSDPRTEFCTFSFHPVKHIATGEGGAVTTHDARMSLRIMALRSHGITRDSSTFLNPEDAFDPETGESHPWYYEMQDLGFNYRLPDINAALGVSQLRKLPSFIERRRQIAELYDTAFSDTPLIAPIRSDLFGTSAYHLYVIQLKAGYLIEQKHKLVTQLRTRGIGTQVHYIPVPRLPYYTRMGYETPQSAMRFYNCSLSIPMFAALTDTQAQRVISEVLECITGATP